MSSKKKKKSDENSGVIATNRRAFRDYVILDKLEAGLELKGTEVKSIRAGHVRIEQAFIDIRDGEAYIQQMTVDPYDHGSMFNHVPTRPRRLLMHKTEILRFQSKMAEKGLTTIPLRVYIKEGKIKIKIALCKGKDASDKRETLKKKSADMEARRAIRNRT